MGQEFEAKTSARKLASGVEAGIFGDKSGHEKSPGTPLISTAPGLRADSQIRTGNLILTNH